MIDLAAVERWANSMDFVEIRTAPERREMADTILALAEGLGSVSYELSHAARGKRLYCIRCGGPGNTHRPETCEVAAAEAALRRLTGDGGDDA